MATPSFSVDSKTNTVTIVIAIPLPNVTLPTVSIGFPPKLPLLKIPLIPEALKGIATVLAQLQAIITKLMSLIPQAAIHLIIKLGPTVIFDQTFTTADALATAVGLTLCKK